MVKVILKDGWIYRGKLILETETTLTILDRKVGEIEIAKDSCAIISRGEF